MKRLFSLSKLKKDWENFCSVQNQEYFLHHSKPEPFPYLKFPEKDFEQKQKKNYKK